MARISAFFRTTTGSRAHPTEVECGYQVVDDGAQRLLQLATYGSRDRVSGQKVSQTLQLDRERAEELIKIIQRAFPQR